MAVLRHRALWAYLRYLSREEFGTCVACSYLDTYFTNGVAHYVSVQAPSEKKVNLEVILDTPQPGLPQDFFMPTFHTGAGVRMHWKPVDRVAVVFPWHGDSHCIIRQFVSESDISYRNQVVVIEIR